MPSKGSVLPNKATAGCRNCRNRRIICDGAQPCRKCQQKGLECEWGKGRIKIRFKDETRKLQEKHAERIAAVSPSASAPLNPEDGAASSSLVQVRSAPPFPTALALTTSAMAEKIFFDSPKESMFGMLQDPWITTNFGDTLDTAGKPYLKLAIEVITMSSFANSMKRADAARAAAVASIKCARELRSTLANWQPGACTDDLLFAILLLITNEFVVYKYKGPNVEPDIRMHVKGALAVAAHSFSNGQLTQRQKNLMSTLRLDAGWDCMIAGLPLPAFMYPKDDPTKQYSLEDQLEALYMKGVKLRAESHAVHTDPDEGLAKLETITRLIDEAQAMSGGLGNWTESFAIKYDMRIVGASYEISDPSAIDSLEVWPGTIILCGGADMASYFRLGKAHQLRIFALSIVIRGLCWMKMRHESGRARGSFSRQRELALAIYMLKETVNILCGMLTVVLGLHYAEHLPADLAHLKSVGLSGGSPSRSLLGATFF